MTLTVLPSLPPLPDRPATQADTAPVLAGRYTLFSRIPVAIDAQGQVHATHLWQKDLELHLDYLPDFALCCPVIPFDPANTDLRLVHGLHAARIHPLRRDGGPGSALVNLLPNFFRVARAVRESRIVHSDGAGWAFPLPFYLLPLHVLRPFPWVMVIESSFWMQPKTGASLRQRLGHIAHATLLRRALLRADLRIFTQDGYRRFFGIAPERSLIAPAVWIDEDQILSRTEAEAARAALPKDEIRLLFPARLVAEKGVEVVLEAARLLEARLQESYPGGTAHQDLPRLRLDIIGAGPLADMCRAASAALRGPRITLGVLDPVPYGPDFFALLQRYHAIVLANRQNEQPRILFDAFARAVPAVTSATEGVCDMVTDGREALLFGVDDPEAMVAALLRFAGDADLRARLSRGALARAQGQSHHAMHRTRARHLARIFG
ncbi:glycosyltransferase family 4 protein (plasmid) [Thioclava sp. 'Guangxiensis']|uniref:glycosyltransferase family 4 protein n=1 Tax=Thioclava sp. 'Guangxiensis' TaxID=3149044 RepID=UPI0032C3DD10